MQKDGSIIISSPQKGIANSAILGNEAIIGCELFDEPGVLKIQSALEEDSTPANSSLTGVPIADVTNYNPANTIQRTIVTSTGQVFSGANADNLMATNSFGWDACVWNSEFTVVSYAAGGVGYLGCIYHDQYGGVSWFSSRAINLTATHYIKLLMAQDGYMYFTNGNTIGRVTALVNVAGTVTMTYSTNVLDLPPNVYAVTMAELGNKLMIGTQKGYSYGARQTFNSADIYPWDRVSSSFSLPVQVNENGMNAMISNKNQIFFSAGDDGRIYVTDGTNYQLVKRLPYNRGGRHNPTSWVYPNAMCVNQQGHLMVGLSANYDANSPTTTGIWEIALTQGYPTHLPFFSRDGNLGQTANVRFGSVRVLNDDALTFGVESNSTFEVSTTSSTDLNTGYTAKWRTEFFMVGSRKNRKSFNNLEFTLLEPLIANQGIRIAYRKNRSESFTTIGTFTYATLGSVISHETKALISDAEMVQFEVSLEYTSATFGENVNLIRITVN